MTYRLADLSKLPRIAFTVAPRDPISIPLSLARLRDIVFSCQVRARGWYFPHFKPDELIGGPSASYLESETEARSWIEHLERWRFYASGQFVFEEMLWEVPDKELQDRMRSQSRFRETNRANSIDGFVSFVGLIYYVSEAFTFASNLAQTIPYAGPVTIASEVKSIKNWALGSTDFSVDIEPFAARTMNLQSRKVVAVDELVAEPLELATAAITELFQQFGFLEPSPRMISTWQSEIFKIPKRV